MGHSLLYNSGRFATRNSTAHPPVVEFFELPEAYLAKQLQKLSGAGLVETRRGPKGGYALAKPAADITLLALDNAIHGSERHFRCSELRQCGPTGVSPKNYPRPCGIARSMWKAEAKWSAELSNTTLKDIQMMGYSKTHPEQALKALNRFKEKLAKP